MGAGFSSCGVQQSDNIKKNPQCDQCSKCQHADATAENQPIQTSDRVTTNPRAIRLFDNGVEENVSTSSSPSNQRTKFYYYPKRNGDRDPRETIFVTTSQFPYTRPKAVVVRPRPVEKVTPQPQVNTRDNQKDVNDVHGKEFLMYNEEYPTVPHATKTQNKSYQFVNERRWSNPNVMKTDNYPSNTVLPHKTVLELRSSNQVQPYGRHFSYVCDMEPSFASENLIGLNRPPTPGTNIWYPARRTSDYLVASSLLAVEQTHDRQRNKTVDIHDF